MTAITDRAAAYHLTRRETQIASMVMSGLPNKSIARLLVIEISTVKFHVNGILRKTHSRNRTEATYKMAAYC